MITADRKRFSEHIHNDLTPRRPRIEIAVLNVFFIYVKTTSRMSESVATYFSTLSRPLCLTYCFFDMTDWKNPAIIIADLCASLRILPFFLCLDLHYSRARQAIPRHGGNFHVRNVVLGTHTV